MKTFPCICGNTLFFSSTRCVKCERPTAMCPGCRAVSPIEPVEFDRTDPTAKTHRCLAAGCQTELRLCGNAVDHGVCNRAVAADDETLCEFCRLNSIVPDLSIVGNLEKWSRLETAKHRALFGVVDLGLPIIGPGDGGEPTLEFEFKASTATEPVSTGHADGLITIDIAEADSVQREKTRVQFGEPQRTLVGHFRHELGHYYWDLLVKSHRLDAFRELFGDETDPDYATAQKRYYEQGPQENWRESFISGYASMHPWEDFAETFAEYLDMAAILTTTNHFGVTDVSLGDIDAMITTSATAGIFANELNRDMGLLDLVPEVFTKPVLEKLRFMHELQTVAESM